MFRKVKTLLVVLLSVTAMQQVAQAVSLQLPTLPPLPAPTPPASQTTVLNYGQNYTVSGSAGSVRYFMIPVTASPSGAYVKVEIKGGLAGNGWVKIEKLLCSAPGGFSTNTSSTGTSASAWFSKPGFYYFMVRGNQSYTGTLRVTNEYFGG